MAFNYFDSEEDNQKNESGSQGQLLGSASPVVTGNNAASSDGSKGTNSGSFTNLQQYLDKNSSLNFGGQLAGKVDEVVTGAQDAQKDTDSQFKSQVDSSTVKKDDNVIKSLNEDPINTDYDAFVKMRDAKYSGPNSIVDTDLYQPLYDKTQKAVSSAEATKSEGGRKALLDENYGAAKGRYDYTSGQKKLDNLLIQNDPNSRQAFADVQDKASAVNQNLSALQQQLDAYANQGKQATTDTRSAARGAVGIDDAGNLTGQGAIGGLQGILSQTAQQKQAQQAQDYAAYQAALKARDYASSGAKLGIDQNTGPLYNLDLGSYLSRANDVNANTVASQQQAAQLQALAKLAGAQQLGDASVAGKYSDSNAPLVTFDKDSFSGALSNAKGNFDSNLSSQNAALGGYQNELRELIKKANTTNPFTGGPMISEGDPYQEYGSNSADHFATTGNMSPSDLARYKQLKALIPQTQSGIDKLKATGGLNDLWK